MEDLAKRIGDLNLTPLPKLNNAPTEDHSTCKGPSFKEEVERIMSRIPSPALACHLEHMEKRSKPAVPEENPLTEDGGGNKSLMVILKVPNNFKLQG